MMNRELMEKIHELRSNVYAADRQMERLIAKGCEYDFEMQEQLNEQFIEYKRQVEEWVASYFK